MKPSKLVATPIIPQDHYRNALQQMLKLDEPFPLPEKEGQAGGPSSLAAPTNSNLPPHQPRDFHYYHQLGGAGAERQPHQGFTKTHVPPPTIPVGMIAPGLVDWQRETKGCLKAEWPVPASTGGITPMLRRGNVIPGGRWGESSGGPGTGRGAGRFGGAAEGAGEPAGSDVTAASAAAASAAASAAAAAAGQASDRKGQQQQEEQQRQHEQYQKQKQQQQQQQQYQQRAARTGRSSDLRK